MKFSLLVIFTFVSHDRGFLYEPRGFSNIEEHNEAIVENWNKMVRADDDVYVLGDLMLNNNERGLEYLSRLNGRLHVVYGNHDTNTRKELYKSLPNVVEVCGYATMIKYDGYTFYLSHYPTITTNLDDKGLKHCVLNIHGHTHDKRKFYQDNPTMFNAALDANNNVPVPLSYIIACIKGKVLECKIML